MLAGLTLSPRLVLGAMRGAAAQKQPAAAAAAAAALRGLVVGLGGGALPMVLQRYLPGLALSVCDIDAELEAVAREHFGFRCGERCRVVISEGMQLLTELRLRLEGATATAAASGGAAAGVAALSLDSAAVAAAAAVESAAPLDVLIIDVDSKDTSVGMSAPPRSFATLEALETMHAVLRPGGLLAVNVAARSDALFSEFVALLRAVFGAGGRIYSVRGAEDVVNVTVLAVRQADDAGALAAPVPAAATGKGKDKDKDKDKAPVLSREQLQVKERQARDGLLEDWLKASGLPTDPLELGLCLAKLQRLD